MTEDFINALEEVKKLYEARGDSFTKAQTSGLAEQSLMVASVLWEGYVGDLFVAYINRDSSMLLGWLRGRIETSVKAKFGSETWNHVRLAFPKHLNKDAIYGLLDPDDKNLTFSSAKKMVQKAEEALVDDHARVFRSLSKVDEAVIDATKAMRNFVAHRSESSKKVMNEALGDNNLPNCLRRGRQSIHNLGAHLKASHGGRPRIIVHLGELRRIANTLQAP